MICLHGYRSSGQVDCQDAAERLWQAGHNVLVPDLRGHGQSEGLQIGLGWLDRLDLILWIEKLVEKRCAMPDFLVWSRDGGRNSPLSEWRSIAYSSSRIDCRQQLYLDL